MPKFDLQPVLDKTPGHVSGKHEGPSPKDASAIFDAILDGGKDAIIALVDQLKEIDDGSDYKARFLLHGVATYACGPDRAKHRQMMAATLAEQLGGDRPATVKAYLLQTLQLIADKSVAAAIGKHLHDDQLGDPAAAALVAIGKDGAAELRAALKDAKGRAQQTLVQSLGVLKDGEAAKQIAVIADASTGEVKVTALSALANIGDASSVERLLKAADAATGIARDRSTRACFVLAENLAAVGRVTEARAIYQHLKTKRTGDDEQFIRDAGERGLKAIEGLKQTS